jgi:hypothetical protein
MSDLDFYIRVLRCFDRCDCHGSVFWRTDGNVFWRTDGGNAPLTFIANCNDVFWWATADGEKITPENISILEKCADDLLLVQKQAKPYVSGQTEPMDEDQLAPGHLSSLFAARVRKMRPQRPYFRYCGEQLKKLFEACGPERDPKDEG